ncbi:MAG TPA: biotin synthase BioB, partial [Verrucomicrobia bacterium]|nr:biotin synthase BioB [Verrucomicrobiota bacterium]
MGLQVCSGGIFGMGETDAQVAELALELKRLRVDSVPVNFLVPVEGTPMAGAQSITPQRCLKVTAMLRFILGGPEILIGGGRADNLKHLHSLVFMAG